MNRKPWQLGVALGLVSVLARAAYAQPVEPTTAASAPLDTVAAPATEAETTALATEAATAAPATEAAPAQDSAEQLYHLAFIALASGDTKLASDLLQALVREHPAHALAAHAQQAVTLIAQLKPAVIVDNEAPPRLLPLPRARRSKTAAARAEAVFVQSVHGLTLGLELCGVIECEDEKAWVGMLMLGAGSGFAASFLASKDGITPGFARALTDGALWGAGHGLMVMLTTGVLEGSNEDSVVPVHLALGQILGLGASALLYTQLEPSTGQVSLTSSGGIWSLAIMGQALGAFGDDIDDNAAGALLLIASDLGLIAGGALAYEKPMSTSRVLMIDAGGLVGAITGLGLSVLVQADPEREPTFGAGMAGTIGGLALTYFLTQHWDDTDDDDARAGSSIHAMLTPVPGGLMAIANARF